MSPIDYLRAMAIRRRRGPAYQTTAAELAHVAPLVERALETTAVEIRVDNSESRFTTATPTAVIEFSEALTREQVQRLRERIQIGARPAAPIPAREANGLNCGCWPRYVNCRHTKIGAS